MGRLTDDDRRWGPFTWGRSSWNLWRAVWSSGGGAYDEGDPRNDLTVYFAGWVVRVWLPTLLRPRRRWVDCSSYAWSTSPAGGYWDVKPREYGFCLIDGHLMLFLGAQTDDSSTTQSWSCFLPWTQWRHVRFTLYDLEGREFWTQEDRADVSGMDKFEAQREAERLCPKAVFEFDDSDGKRIRCTTHIQEREYRRGTNSFRWLSWFTKPRISRSLNLEFSEQVGPEKGSWKGGMLGHGIEMWVGEDAEAAFRRYCDMDQRSKFGAYRITYVGRVA